MQLLLYGLGNWAFLKRNGLGEKVYGVETYRLLLPIPWTEIDVNLLKTEHTHPIRTV